MHARRGGDVDYAAGLAVSDTEEGGSFADEFEGGGVMEGYYVVPLFVGHLLARGHQHDLLVFEFRGGGAGRDRGGEVGRNRRQA